MKNLLPSDAELERFVLASVLLIPALLDEQRGRIGVEDFTVEQHRRTWTAITGLYDRGEKLDRVMVYQALSASNSGVSLSWLAALDDGLPQLPAIDSYVDRLKEKTLRRSVVLHAQNLASRAQMPDEDIHATVDAFGSMAAKLADTGTQGGAIISTATMLAETGLDSLLGPRAVHGGPPLPWGTLQDALCGFSPGQMALLMAETSKGKSSFGLQAASHAAATDHAPLVWSLEMPERAMFRRLVSQISGQSLNGRGQYSFSEREAHRLAVNQLDEHPVYFDCGSRSVTDLRAKLRRLRTRVKIGLLVVDYIQRVPRSEGHTRAERVSNISRDLAMTALDFQIPVLVLSQVDRSSVKGDGEINLHSGKESGDLENDADVVLWIKAPKELSRDQDTPVSIHVGKQREGPAGFDVRMVFRPQSQTFVEV